MDLYEAFLRRLEADAKPLFETKERSREFAFQFSRDAIRTGFLLNGGALVALPTFGSLLGDIKATAGLFVGSVGTFVLGLVLISITSMLAYLALGKDVEVVEHRLRACRIRANNDFKPEGDQEKVKKEIAGLEAQADEGYADGKKLGDVALYCGIGSLISFVVGAIMAGFVLMAASGA